MFEQSLTVKVPGIRRRPSPPLQIHENAFDSWTPTEII